MGPSLHGYRDDVCERGGLYVGGDVMSGEMKVHAVASAFTALVMLTALVLIVPTMLTVWPMAGFLILIPGLAAGIVVCVYSLAFMCAEALLGERLSSTTENDD